WFYTADRLKVGGFMIVDDTHVGTGAILAAFMDVDPRWDQVLVQPERFAIYRKRRGPVHLGDWVAQPFLRDAFPTVAARLISVSDAAAERALIEELQATRTLLEVVRGERDQAIAMARDTAERLRTVESTAEQLRAVERALVEQLEHMRTLVDVVRGERDQAIATVRDAVERIRAMESTKFWKARRVWFRLRRLLRLPGHE
ncbi:MAG TPA: hypothetical protein VK548_08035, partial [Candidatus Acidoferrum sp.]|nr:hypothetical protein [Candidatus Acidoferrum sp.]